MTYDPRYVYLYPASIPQIVAHIQEYLRDNPITSTATITQMIINELSEHPEVLNGAEIPITAEDQQSIKDYIDHLPSVDGYTKEQVNTLLDEKQDVLTFDQAPTPDSSNPVTSSGISTAITTAIVTLTALINLKANLSDVYTKSVIDQLLSGKANTADVYTKTSVDQLLAAKADETEVTDLKSALNATDALLVGDGKANVELWESGSISDIGGNTANNARIRIKTDKRIGLTEGQLAVTCADGYEMFFVAYNSEYVYVGKLQTDGKIGDGDGVWTQSLNLIAYPDYVFRIVLRNKTTPTAQIEVSESSNVFFHGEKYVEKNEGVETSPYVFDAINVNIESGIYDRWNNFYQTGQHVSIPVSEGEKYLIVAGSFPSTDFPLYLLKKDNRVVGYKNVSSAQMVQEELTVNAADMLIINSTKACISVCKGYAVTAKPFSKWAGKKIAWFGTSIPETSTYNAVLGYPEYVGKLLGATVYNEAVGSSTARRGFKTAETANDPYGWTGMGIAALWNMGSTIAEKNEIITNWESKWRNLTGYNATMTEGISSKALACSYENKLVQKYITENPVDLYVFDHGYNDWKVGDLDMNPDDPYDRSTFQGAMNTFIKLIMESNPHARILIVSHYEDQERPGLIEMQKGEAEYWNLPFARLYDRLGWANNRTVTTTGYWSNGTGNGYWIKSGGTEQTLTLKQYHMPDGRHPNIDISGRACMDIAHVLAEMIDSITPAN